MYVRISLGILVWENGTRYWYFFYVFTETIPNGKKHTHKKMKVFVVVISTLWHCWKHKAGEIVDVVLS